MQPFSEDEEFELERYFTGTKKDFSKAVAEGKRDGTEGARHLTVAEYISLCLESLTRSHSRHSTELHLFILIAWNMVSRLETTTMTHSRNLSWENDALLIGVSKSKRNETEDLTWYRNFANPFLPQCCLVLGLAIHCATDPNILGVYLFHLPIYTFVPYVFCL